MMQMFPLHVLILYCFAATLLVVAIRTSKKLRNLSETYEEHVRELAITFDGKCQLWESRQSEIERVTTELTVAKEQQESLLTRNLSNRAMRKDVLVSLRGGMRPDAISTKFELPRSEVRLLAKVHTILTDAISRS